MANTSIDNFKFSLIGTEQASFIGYISSEDPTKVSPRALVRGSQNVFLNNNGNIVNRDGRKRYDPVDDSDDPVVGSFDWNDLKGNLLLIRVLKSGVLQFYNKPDSTWYTIYTFPETNTDISFAKWWDINDSKEVLVMCNGTPNLFGWSGGIVPNVGQIFNNTVQIKGNPVTNLSATVVDGVGINYRRYANTDSNIDLTFVFEENPTDGTTILLQVTNVIGSVVAEIYFVDVLSDPPFGTQAYVLIGSTLEETASNFRSLLENPGNDSQNYMGFSSSGVVDVLSDSSMTYSLLDSLESPTEETWDQLGFTDNGSLNINGVEYPYGLVVGRWLTGFIGNPPTDQLGFQSLIVTPNSNATGSGIIKYPSMENFDINFILCLNNQILAFSNTSRIVHISFNEDYKQFVQNGDLIIGDPDYVILDEFPLGGATKGGAAYVGAGVNAWYEITPNTEVPYVTSQARTVYAKVVKFSGSGLTAPLGFNFVTTWGEDIIFTDQQNQLRTLGIYRNIFEQKSPSLSLLVREELQTEDFTGGCIRAIGEFIYMISPISGKTYLYQIRDDVDSLGNITSRRLWQPPQTWNISRLSIVNGIPHGYSNESPQLYQLFATNQWHDDTSKSEVFAPYICIARFGYRQLNKGDDRNKYEAFDKIYYEGYIAPNSDLEAKTVYDYQGYTHIEDYVISNDKISPVLFDGDPVNLIGDSVIGNEIIGGGYAEIGYNVLPKFRVINNVPIKNVFEYQLQILSKNLDSRWELVALGGNERFVTDNPVYLQKPI